MAIADHLRRRKKFVTCQKYFVCQVIKWHMPERVEGHSMCIALNKLDRVLWMFEPLQSQRIRKLNQLYPNCVKQYYQLESAVFEFRVDEEDYHEWYNINYGSQAC